MSYRVIFSHANGYPAGSYRVLTEAVDTQYSIRPFDHRPLWGEPPPGQFLSWQTYANDLIERIEADQAGPVWLIGHSMGAASGILAAARRPELFAGIVALDPVLIPTRIWFWSVLVNRLMPSGMPIIKRALARPHEFDDLDTAFTFYRGKRVFSAISDEVLRDYVEAGHAVSEGGRVRLRYSGAWEACVYRSVPRMTPSLSALICPVLIVAGDTSTVLTPAILEGVHQLNSRISSVVLPGGHLLPLESPEQCAEQALAFIEAHDQVL